MRGSSKRVRRRRFRAPLSRGARALGAGITLFLWGVAAGQLFLVAGKPTGVFLLGLAGALICGLTPVALSLFLVYGYEVAPRELRVRRLLWTTRIPLKELQGAWVDPGALKRAWKVIGNGGVFGWQGRFRSKRLGRFRALATDPARSVVLDFGRDKLVVSPDRPADLVRALGFDPESPAEKAPRE